MTLNQFRYRCYDIGIRKPSFTLRSLPPSESAAMHHSYRVYYQVQSWCNIARQPDQEIETDDNSIDDKSMEPTNWGWKFVDNVYKPIFADGKLVPDEVLKMIRCKCVKDCKRSCSCVKHGVKCSEFCANCKGHNCSNKEESIELPLENEDEENDDETDSLAQYDEEEVQSDDGGITYDIPNREESDSSEESDYDEDSCPPSKRTKTN